MTTFGLEYAAAVFSSDNFAGDFSPLSFLLSLASAIALSRASDSALARSTSSALTTIGSSRDDLRTPSSSSPSTPVTGPVCSVASFAASLLDFDLTLAPGRLRRANGTKPPSSGCTTAFTTCAGGVAFTGFALCTRESSTVTPLASRLWTAPPSLADDHASSRSTTNATGPRVTARSLGLARSPSPACLAYIRNPRPCGAAAPGSCPAIGPPHFDDFLSSAVKSLEFRTTLNFYVIKR